ncbi:aldo/keto reductase [Streptomyces thermodiastaticus]|uniref:aldo/keto reductase n=1 Tax=Streptomyces thermodiastaticus TaxID=44061 RepID=UPI001671F303|nr:aldo/keto reductase [Streptomyces thermodiastaticus]MCE7548654.1 aldo/keto reductase [Streptomyces thermodiastaticus]GHF81309.1 aldo/keto reductase [Streptomyces thermodiastaticus]
MTTTGTFRLATVRLGRGGPAVGVQGLGCMGMSFAYGPTDTSEARATLEHALERGVTLFDTADVYGAGANEELLAPFIAAHRDDVVVATKFGIVMDPQDPTRRTVRGDRSYVRGSIEASLRRLGTDHVDLYYMHRRDPAVPIEETVAAMAELVAEGKVAHLGLSEVTADEIRAAAAVHPIAAVQCEWSLFSRGVEDGVVAAVRETGAALVPYSPLGRGFLAGLFHDAEEDLHPADLRRILPRYTGEAARSNQALLSPLRHVARRHGATLGQIALAWVHHQAARHGLPVVPIPGTRRPQRVAENTAATRIALTPDDLSLLDPLAAQVVGARYPGTLAPS